LSSLVKALYKAETKIKFKVVSASPTPSTTSPKVFGHDANKDGREMRGEGCGIDSIGLGHNLGKSPRECNPQVIDCLCVDIYVAPHLFPHPLNKFRHKEVVLYYSNEKSATITIRRVVAEQLKMNRTCTQPPPVAPDPQICALLYYEHVTEGAMM
jgi:hypothetical protein